MQAGALQQTLAGHEDPVRAIACLDTHFLTVCRNVVRVWDLRACEEMDRFTVKKRAVQDIQVSPDGTYLFAASARSLRIWDLRMKREVKNCSHRGKIETLRLNEDGSKLCLATIDHKVRIFDVPALPGGSLAYEVRLVGGREVEREVERERGRENERERSRERECVCVFVWLQTCFVSFLFSPVLPGTRSTAL